MAAYKVVGKHHYRAQVRDEEGHDARGNAFIVRNPAPAVRIEVGAVLTDVTPAELEAFPDRFVEVEEVPVRVASGRERS